MWCYPVTTQIIFNLDLGVSDMAILIAAKHFVQRRIINFCFMDLLDSYNRLWMLSLVNLDGLLLLITFN